MKKNEIKPLLSDENRQASPIIGGYVYQAWQSLYVWINLQKNDVLYLEGAEDADVLSKLTSTTIQYKHLSKNVTLRSEESIDAIINYWNLRKKEQRQVVFHLFTNAGIGKEQGDPFKGKKGIEYWEQCKKPSDVELIRQFLLTITRLPGELIEFIKQSSNEDLLLELIQPINWLTEKSDLEGIRKKVEDNLINHGDENGCKVSTSKRAASVLFEIVMKTLCKDNIKDRCLNRADFLDEFEKATHTTISQDQLQILQSAAFEKTTEIAKRSMVQINPTGNIVSTLTSKPYKIDVNVFTPRIQLQKKISTRLIKTDILAIRGSSGMGKSVLTLLAVEKQNDEWERVSFRGLKGDNIKLVLESLCNSKIHKPKNIILDDINFGQDKDAYLEAFQKLAIVFRRLDKKILTTTQKRLPVQIRSNLGLNEDNEIQIPKFNEDEVKKLLSINKCPPELIPFWIKDLEITSKFHPQLTHARVKKLREKKWNKSEAIFKTEELIEVKQEVVGSLVSEIPSEEARDLLLRTSILTGLFKQKNVLALSAFPKKIPTPGIFFNQLVGPYIEQTTEDYYSLSPLLENAFRDNFTDQEVLELHKIAGESYLSKTLTPRDLSNLFLHGLLSQSGRILFFAFSAFQSIKSKEVEVIYPYLQWLTAVHIGTNQAAFPKDEVMNLMFRSIQFTIAVETKDGDSAISIADVWFKEIKGFEANGPFKKEEDAKSLPLMFYLSVFKYQSLNIPMSKCLEWLIEADRFLEGHPKINEKFKFPSNEEDVSWESLIPEVALTKRINETNIEDFMESVKTLPGATKFFRKLDSNPILPKRIVDNVWLGEIDKKDPNWEQTINTLKRLLKLAKKYKAINTHALIIRAIAIINNEYLYDKKSANNTIKLGVAEIGPAPEIINYKAKMFYIDEKYGQAVETWKKILPELAKQDKLVAAFAYRDAAVSSAKLDNLKQSSRYFLTAADCAKRSSDKIYETQCLADYALSLWKLGKHKESIETFLKVVSSFASLPSPLENLRVLGLLKMVGNTLIYLRKTVCPEYTMLSTNYSEPYLGIHSQTEYNESLKKLQIAPPKTLLTYLAEIEESIESGNTAYKRLILEKNDFPVLFRVQVAKIQANKILKKGDLACLIDITSEFFTFMSMSLNRENRHEIVLGIKKVDLKQSIRKYYNVIINTLSFSFVCLDSFADLPIESWKKSAKELDLDNYEEWKVFIAFLETIDLRNAQGAMWDSGRNPYIRISGAIFVLMNDTDRNNLLYSSAIIASSIKESSTFSWVLSGKLTDLLVKKWSEIAETLNGIWHDEESTTVIKECKRNSRNHFSKAARIVLAAEKISSLNIVAVRLKLEKLAFEQE